MRNNSTNSFALWMVICVIGCGELRGGAPLRLDAEQRSNRELVIQRLLGVAIAGLTAGGEADLAAADDALKFAAEIAPHDRRVLDGLGGLAMRRRDLPSAKRYFQAAIVSDPAYSRPYAHLALVAEAEGDLEAALALTEEALRRNPLNYLAREHRAALEVRRRDTGFAKRSAAQVEEGLSDR